MSAIVRVAKTGPGAVVLGSDFKALGVVRSLGSRGIPCVVIDSTPRSAWFSRYTKRRFHWRAPMDSPEFVDFVLRLGKEQRLDGWILFPLQDEVVELVAHNTATLGQVFRLATQDWAVARWACDKHLTYEMAERVGVPSPRTWYPAREDDLDTLDIVYPAIIKPSVSVRLQYAIRVKALPAANTPALREQYRRAAGIMPADEIMVQQIIPGGGDAQVSVAAYCKDGEIIASMTARRWRQYPIDYGLGSSFVEAVEIPEIVDPAARLLRFMRVTGMIEVEFKRDPRDGEYKLLDINLRPWGWHTLCQSCGLDFPYMQYGDILGHAPEPAQPCYGARWVRILTDVPAGLQEMRAGLTTPWSYLHSLQGKTVFSVFDWRDLAPAAGDVAIAVSRSARRAMRRRASV